MNEGFWNGKNVFITGANGFIGSWLAKELVEKGANVIALIRDIIPNSYLNLSGTAQKINIINGSLTDFKLISRIVNEYEVDVCFHLAAQAIVGTANRSPLSTFESNIKGTWNILEACRNSKTIKGVVVASSDKAYGVQNILPYVEDTSLLGRYPYDASKACADILTQSYYHTYRLPVAITRNANIYGGGDLNFSRLIPDAICSALQNKQFVIRSDGKFERDYMYIKDAVNAYLTLGENLNRKEIQGQAFNFGVETPISVLEVIQKINELIGNNIPPIILNEAKNEINRQFLSTKKAKELLNWVPKYCLSDGIKETIAWYNVYLINRGLSR
ncbi:MAG: GDP-mannose 4,6-dehydratase [Candidatus Margulisbacteria bacterium]|nr:GDP-mannose 4,6-dehydratase [Candidatus Margulisiibacteriota bacterium]